MTPAELVREQLEDELMKLFDREGQLSARATGMVIVATVAVSLAVAIDDWEPLPHWLLAIYVMALLISMPAIIGRRLRQVRYIEHAEDLVLEPLDHLHVKWRYDLARIIEANTERITQLEWVFRAQVGLQFLLLGGSAYVIWSA